MAEQVDMLSLATLASIKGSTAKEKTVTRMRTSSVKGADGAARGKAGFDGFLKTFLGDDKASSGGRKTGLSRGRNSATARPAARSESISSLFSRDGSSVRPDASLQSEQVDNTAPAEEQAENQAAEAEVAEYVELPIEFLVELPTELPVDFPIDLSLVNPVETLVENPVESGMDIPADIPVESDDILTDEAVAAAAAEAARQIWDLLYGQSGAGTLDAANLDAQAGDPLGQLLGAVTGQEGQEVAENVVLAELSVEVPEEVSVTDALDLTNAGAEANNEAVLEEVEKAITEMSLEELEQTLSQAIAGKEEAAKQATAETTGETPKTDEPAPEAAPRAEQMVDPIRDPIIDVEALNAMAEELNAEVVSVNDSVHDVQVDVQVDFLAELAGQAVYTRQQTQPDSPEAVPMPDQEAVIMPDAEAPETVETAAPARNVPVTAESAGTNTETADPALDEKAVTELFEKFIEEKNSANPMKLSDPVSAEQGLELAESFAAWLTEKGKVNEAKVLTEHPNKFIQTLVSGLHGKTGVFGEVSTPTTGEKEIFTHVRANLEKLLQNTESMKANEAGHLPLGDVARKLNQGLFEEVIEPGFNGAGFGDAVRQADQGTQGVAVTQQQSPLPSLARADSTNPAAMSTMMDQIENIERVAEAMKMASKGAVKNLTVQLTPEELGKVVLKVESRDGVVNAYLRVEKPEAVAQLGSNLAQLRENLKAAGIELGEVSIEQRGNNETLGDFSGSRRDGNETEEARNRIHWKRPDAEGGTEEEPAAPPPGVSGPGGVNFLA